MTPTLSELAEAEQRRIAVQNAAAEFLRHEWSLSSLRECFERAGSVDAPALWTKMQQLGWHRIGTDAGDAFGAPDLCAIVEEIGRALAPTPVVPCAVGHVTLRSTNTGLIAELPVLAHGEAKRTTDRLHTSVVAAEVGGGHRLSGEKRFVPYGLQADLLIVSATVSSGTLGIFAVDPHADGVDPTMLRLLDGSACAEVRLHDAAATPIAWGEDAERALGDALTLETIARCAELVGVADRALELAVEYAKHRVAFDRPIGSFQAVQHKLVDLRTHVEVARALYQGAAAAGPEERRTAASMAAFAALDGLRQVPEGALQVFGGIGTTWEHDIHFFLRRAATLAAFLGERGGFREDIVRHLEATHG